ncbi:hypothetical protein [Vibrio cincinnatiensis]|uniref:hypothetical protein n=1 Tax=Vibrio cincinnatiensis TaxID=675 RepID=UPI001EE01923|nr:hypothetical protein [Vibrio cincinnatiensis]MCG3723706.1 hypothetical protein [Vibrio cincinnatiensis]
MSLNETPSVLNSQSVLETLPFKQDSMFYSEPVIWIIVILFLLMVITFFIVRKNGINVVRKYFYDSESRWKLIEKKKLTHDTTLLILLDEGHEIVIVESKANVQVIKYSKQWLPEDTNENEV